MKKRQASLQLIKACIKYFSVFLFMTALLLGFLVLSAMIPQAAIKENVKESAEYLCDGELFGNVAKDVNGSKIDRYADSILLAIAYQYDSDKPLNSVMWSSYYYNELQNENENLLDAVTNNYEANQQYLRYWHGSNVIVRPLLMVFNIKQIYLVNAIVMVVLIACLIVTLIRYKAHTLTVGVVLGLISTSFWFVPMSLEYTWTYLLMLLMSIIGVRLVFNKRDNTVAAFFLIGGMLTSYLDFLTTETITLTVPLLLMLWIVHKQDGQENMRASFVFIGKAVAAWGFGYAGMWIMKWFLASVILSQNVMPYVSEHIGERIGVNNGGSYNAGLLHYICDAIWNNISCLFPFEYGIIGKFIGLALIMFAIYIGYVYHGEKIDKKYVLLYVFIGVIPYVRFALLHNHSYLHYFFTYRAQLATIVAAVMILEQLTVGVWPMRADKKCLWNRQA